MKNKKSIVIGVCLLSVSHAQGLAPQRIAGLLRRPEQNRAEIKKNEQEIRAFIARQPAAERQLMQAALDRAIPPVRGAAPVAPAVGAPVAPVAVPGAVVPAPVGPVAPVVIPAAPVAPVLPAGPVVAPVLPAGPVVAPVLPAGPVVAPGVGIPLAPPAPALPGPKKTQPEVPPAPVKPAPTVPREAGPAPVEPSGKDEERKHGAGDQKQLELQLLQNNLRLQREQFIKDIGRAWAEGEGQARDLLGRELTTMRKYEDLAKGQGNNIFAREWAEASREYKEIFEEAREAAGQRQEESKHAAAGDIGEQKLAEEQKRIEQQINAIIPQIEAAIASGDVGDVSEIINAADLSEDARQQLTEKANVMLSRRKKEERKHAAALTLKEQLEDAISGLLKESKDDLTIGQAFKAIAENESRLTKKENIELVTLIDTLAMQQRGQTTPAYTGLFKGLLQEDREDLAQAVVQAFAVGSKNNLMVQLLERVRAQVAAEMERENAALMMQQLEAKLSGLNLKDREENGLAVGLINDALAAARNFKKNARTGEPRELWAGVIKQLEARLSDVELEDIPVLEEREEEEEEEGKVAQQQQVIIPALPAESTVERIRRLNIEPALSKSDKNQFTRLALAYNEIVKAQEDLTEADVQALRKSIERAVADQFDLEWRQDRVEGLLKDLAIQLRMTSDIGSDWISSIVRAYSLAPSVPAVVERLTAVQRASMHDLHNDWN